MTRHFWIRRFPFLLRWCFLLVAVNRADCIEGWSSHETFVKSSRQKETAQGLITLLLDPRERESSRSCLSFRFHLEYCCPLLLEEYLIFSRLTGTESGPCRKSIV